MANHSLEGQGLALGDCPVIRNLWASPVSLRSTLEQDPWYLNAKQMVTWGH